MKKKNGMNWKINMRRDDIKNKNEAKVAVDWKKSKNMKWWEEEKEEFNKQMLVDCKRV